VIALAWLAGSVCFAVAFLLPLQPVSAAVTAQLVASAVTLGVMVVALRLRLRGGLEGRPEGTGPEGTGPVSDVEELL
jgi:hypothetical protein